jgi:PAS domain S-box-containing protein
MREILQNSNIAIVGGGKVCKAILKIVLGENFTNHKLNILGVADIDDKAEGLIYAREKGIFTTLDYGEVYKIEGLNLIIELTGDDTVLEVLKATKPAKVRLIDHFEAMSVWDFLQIEEKRLRIRRDLRKHISEPERIEKEFDLFSQQLAKIVEERTRHLQTVERELVERERALSQIVQGNTIPTFVINKDHIVTHWNRACEKLTGYKAEEIVGTNKQWLPFRPEKRPAMADVIVDNMEEDEIERYYGDKWRKSALIKGAYEAEEFFPHIGEGGKWLFFTAAPIRGADGETVGSIETLWDTTERKKAQEALQRAHDELETRVEERTAELRKVNEELRRSEEKYKTLFDSAPNPIFIMDRRTFKIIDVNATALDCYKRSKEELLNMTFLDLLFEGDKELEEGLGKLTNNQCAFYPRRRHTRTKGGPFYVNIMACHARHMGADCLIATTTDINENVEREAQLIQASKMTTLGEMSAGIAHELNQPLNTIKMGNEYLRMMIEQGKKIPEQALFQVVNEVSDQVDRTSEIINRLREFGRKADFTKERIDINRSIRGVLDIVGKQLSLQNIEVKLDLDETLPPILAHNNRLQQVIFNLVTNARDAINQKHEAEAESGNRVISIRSFTEDDRAAITVSDTGIGIPEHTGDRIFEAFFTTKEMGEGMGLGLSISYEIVRDYGGEIHVQSEEGSFTTFKLTFPPALE